MGNIFIEPGNSTLEELLATLGEDLYILDAKGGETSGEGFHLRSAIWVYNKKRENRVDGP